MFVVFAHLELLYRRHVVAEHAVLQHGDGVALTAHFLNLLTGAVATGGDIMVKINTLLQSLYKTNTFSIWVRMADIR